MSSISSIANSGMLVAQRRMATSAGNVANMNTDGYEAKREVTSSTTSGAVSSVTKPTADPSYAKSGQGDAAVMASNTNLISERTEQLGAGHAFKANLKVIEADDEMSRSLLDIKA